MPRHPDDKRADLFGDDAPAQRRVAEGQTRARGSLLPEDLLGSLAILSEQDFERLRGAVAEEAARRGRRLNPAPALKERKARSPATDSVTTAKANLVRAAFKAGVKPLAIARQFGLSQAIVRELLRSI
jgi:DNA invertase Pin-like site-specific DNA recombinase